LKLSALTSSKNLKVVSIWCAIPKVRYFEGNPNLNPENSGPSE